MPQTRSYKTFLTLLILTLSLSIAVLIFYKVPANPIKIEVLMSTNDLNLKKYECPIQGDRWVVITTILYPTIAIKKLLNLATKWNVIVIGDRKTPRNWFNSSSINDTRLIFLSLDDQRTLDFQIIKHLSEGSYARKNIGYLIAIKCGAKMIFETDDDNIVETDDIEFLPKHAQPNDVPWIAFRRQRSPFINIYGSFGQPNVWPRGFAVDELRHVIEDGWHSVRQNDNETVNAYIQQYLADLDPDVDALVNSKNKFS